jgi:hypothetical protein
MEFQQDIEGSCVKCLIIRPVLILLSLAALIAGMVPWKSSLSGDAVTILAGDWEVPPRQSRDVRSQALVRGGHGIGRHHEALFRKTGSRGGQGRGEMVVVQHS